MIHGVPAAARMAALAATIVVSLTACLDVPSSRARAERVSDAPVARPAVRVAANADALERRTLEELDSFVGWLADNGVRGFVGEVGWPDDAFGDARRYNHLADRWYAMADEMRLPVSAWATGAHWSDYPLAAYAAPGAAAAPSAGSAASHGHADPVLVANTQAQVLESHLGTSGSPRGIAVAGGSFGDTAPTFSSASPGRPGTDYWYPTMQTLRFVASRGFDFVRIDFRWERIQPVLHAPLDQAELQRIRRVARSAGDLGLGVVLDMHNYGEYIMAGPSGPRRATIGSDALANSALVDVWVRLSKAFGNEPAVIAYGIMNEPHDLRIRPDERHTVATWDRSDGSWRGPIDHDVRRGRAAPGALVITVSDGTDGAFATDGNDELRHCARDGSLLSAWVYLPKTADADAWSASLQVQDVAYEFHSGAHEVLVPGRWTQVRYSVPTGVLGACRAIAMHVSGPPGAAPTRVWVDDLSQRGRLLPAQIWEATSQSVVSALRERGDDTEILVAGHGWSKVQTWTRQHPEAWIIDPDGAVAYEAHHYWNADQDSNYASYSDELLAALASNR